MEVLTDRTGMVQRKKNKRKEDIPDTCGRRKESEEVQALKAELEKVQAVKERFKMMIIKVWKEYDELRDVNVATAEALERETKRA